MTLTREAPKPLRERLSYVEKNGCWEYSGRKTTKDGYGVLVVNGKSCLAHRASYQEYVGDIPDGMLVCHKCDNPPCIRPDHLFLGTNRDNTIDALAKGRRRGYSRQKLTLPVVVAIEKSLLAGMAPMQVAAKFGVHSSSIYRIRSGHMWSAGVRAVPEIHPRTRKEVRNEKRG